MGLLYPDDMISIPFLFHSIWRHCICCFCFIRGRTGSSDLCDGWTFTWRTRVFRLSPSIAIYFLHVFFVSFQVSSHFMDIPAYVPGSLCIRRLCIPFLLFLLFLHPDFHYTICCVLKTAGVHYGLMYVKISLP
jgi:hypothetical protein